MTNFEIPCPLTHYRGKYGCSVTWLARDRRLAPLCNVMPKHKASERHQSLEMTRELLCLVPLLPYKMRSIFQQLSIQLHEVLCSETGHECIWKQDTLICPHAHIKSGYLKINHLSDFVPGICKDRPISWKENVSYWLNGIQLLPSCKHCKYCERM